VYFIFKHGIVLTTNLLTKALHN